jgi:hypothetical protein
VNAGRILRRVGMDSDELRVAIAPVNPDRINVYPASKVLRIFWRPGVKGVTYGGMVFVDPDLIRGDPQRLARLVIHELVHVRQFSDSGYIGFMYRYIASYWKGRRIGLSPRDAYLQIPAEVEARAVTKRVIRPAKSDDRDPVS